MVLRIRVKRKSTYPCPTTMSSGQEIANRDTSRRTFVVTPSFLRAQSKLHSCHSAAISGCDIRASDGPDLNHTDASSPVLFFVFDPVSYRKRPEIQTIERILIEIDHAAVPFQNAAIVPVLHQLCNRTAHALSVLSFFFSGCVFATCERGRWSGPLTELRGKRPTAACRLSDVCRTRRGPG